MKKNIIKFLFALLFFNQCIFSQNECETQNILQLLTSSIEHERSSAIDLILSCNKSELLADLQNSFLTENKLYILQQILDALYQLNVNNIENYAYDFIDKTYTLEKDMLDDEYFSRLFATSILFSINDYSTYNIVFDYVDNRFDRPALLAINMLAEVIEHVPAGSNEAKIKIEAYVQNALIANMRAFGLVQLVNQFGDEYTTVCTDKFYNDNSYIVRNTAFKLLMKLVTPTINTILKERLPDDQDWSIRVGIADTLLLKFGAPSDLKAVIDYQPTEPNETAKSLMGYSIQSFIPPRPTGNTREILNNLNRYIIPELISYDWIGSDCTYDYLGATDNLRSIMENGISLTDFDFDGFCSLLSKAIPQTEEDYNQGTIELGAYKFLHHYFIYILEQFNQEYQQNCEY